MWVVYLITRDDGKMYVGKTRRRRVKERLACHKRSERFKGHGIDLSVIYETESHDDVLTHEARFVSQYDTYRNGLNSTEDGSGNHRSPKFTTLGWSPSEETRRKMRENHWSKNGYASGMLNKKHSSEARKAMSERRKGRVTRPLTLTDGQVRGLITAYAVSPKKPDVIARNGRTLTHLRRFCNENAQRFGMSNVMAHHILSGNTISWQYLYEKILATRS